MLSLVSCLRCLGDIVIRTICALMVPLTIHTQSQARSSQFRRAELWLMMAEDVRTTSFINAAKTFKMIEILESGNFWSVDTPI